MSAGKGDKQRPTDQKKYSNNYDQIDWGKKENEQSKVGIRVNQRTEHLADRQEGQETTHSNQSSSH